VNKKHYCQQCIYKSRAEVQTFSFCKLVGHLEVNKLLSFKALPSYMLNVTSNARTDTAKTAKRFNVGSNIKDVP
jgi:hypothetical protein